MIHQERISDLLLAWHERSEQGEEVSAEELCRDCPELVDELRQHIANLRATDWLFALDDRASDGQAAPSAANLITNVDTVPQRDSISFNRKPQACAVQCGAALHAAIHDAERRATLERARLRLAVKQRLRPGSEWLRCQVENPLSQGVSAMLTLLGPHRTCRGGLSRRDVLRVGALAFGGLSLADMLRLQATAGTDAGRGKSVILIWLRGGPSHIDSYDMKPKAPPEVRGEFQSIRTNVPGIDICEYLPLHAQIMDKLAIVRGIKSNDLGDHTPHYIMTGLPDRGKRPAVGSIVSYLQPRSDGLPPYVSVYRPETEGPTYLGPAHRAFVPQGDGLENLRLARGMTLGRLDDRKQLLKQFDVLRQNIDRSGTFAGLDAFTQKAFETMTTPKAREAFDLGKESAETKARYGRFWQSFLMARRLVEAGVSVVTLKVGDWDTHEHNFRDMRDQLPEIDLGFHALVTDLYDRGLEKQVAVVMWGEFGRAPRISRIAGRDHWPEAGAAVLAGGGFRVGQVIGETDAHGGQATGKPYTPSNVLATVYRHLGIDPAVTIPDHNRRPMYVLDDRELVRELL